MKNQCYSYNFAKKVLNNLSQCYKYCIRKFKEIYCINDQWVITLIRDSAQERWKSFKKVLKFIRYIYLKLPLEEIQGITRIEWKEMVRRFVEGGFDDKQQSKAPLDNTQGKTT